MTKQEYLDRIKQARDAGRYDLAMKLGEAVKQGVGLDQEFSVSEMASNVPGSAWQFAKDVTYPIRHPVETAKGLKDLAVGGYHKFTPGVQPEEANVDAVGKFIMDRYGSMDAFKKTLMNDPVGVLADAATVLTTGGAAIPGRAGSMVGKIGRAIEPVNIAKKATLKPLQTVIPKNLPPALFESAAKFSTTFTPEQRRAMSKTALKEGLKPSSKGVAQGFGMIDALGSQVDALIKEATDKGVMIPKDALFKHLAQVRSRLGGTKLYSGRDAKKINKIIKDFNQKLEADGVTHLTPDEVQAFKRDIYANTNYDTRKMRGTRAGEETEKALARAAKDILEKEAPGVKELNARQGKLIELVGTPSNPGPLARSAARIENRDIAGIGLPLKTLTANQILPGGPGAMIGTGVGLLDTPKIKANLAFGLDKFLSGDFLNKPLPTALHSGLFQIGRSQNR